MRSPRSVSALGAYAGFDALASSILDEVAAVAAADGIVVDTAETLPAPANALITQLIELLEATWPYRVNGVHADTQ